MARKTFAIFSLTLLILHNCFAAQRALQYIFTNGKEGYNMYRIPAVVCAKSGKLLAFCEGRQSLLDDGNIDLVMKTSVDGGKTWSALSVVWNHGKNTCGNPSPVVDAVNGNIVLVATKNNRDVFVIRSKDEGVTWNLPVDITTQVKPSTWRWYATGPVHGVQLTQSEYQNRLVIPCNHTIKGAGEHISHIIYSDDGGNTWHLGGSVAAKQTDECTVAEISGQLMLNMRNSERSMPNRKVAYSNDGGLTWSACLFDSALIEPVCQGSLLRYSISPEVLLFANPSSTKRRRKLVVKVSYNGGKTWSTQIAIAKGPSAYSDMAIMPSGNVLCLFEGGRFWPYGGIAMVVVRKDQILK